MKSINEELTKGQKEYLEKVMESCGYGLWDVTDSHIIYFDKLGNEDEVQRLLAFKTWKSVYDYANKISGSSLD